MITKEITYTQLEQAIQIAFSNDKDIFRLYDQNVIVSNLDELVSDISKKIKSYPDIVLKGVYDKWNLIGYIVYKDDILISFALAVPYRVRKHLGGFYQLIRKELKGRFYCTLWSRNIRAVKWLMKNGLKIIDTNPHLTKLIHP